MTKDELKMFHEKSASGLCIRVYYSTTQLMEGKSSFPSIKSIAERMGSDLTQNYKQTIGRALRWLRREGLIDHKSLVTRQSEVKCGIYQIKTSQRQTVRVQNYVICCSSREGSAPVKYANGTHNPFRGMTLCHFFSVCFRNRNLRSD